VYMYMYTYNTHVCIIMFVCVCVCVCVCTCMRACMSVNLQTIKVFMGKLSATARMSRCYYNGSLS
jgi:hypothetical protein